MRIVAGVALTRSVAPATQELLSMKILAYQTVGKNHLEDPKANDDVFFFSDHRDNCRRVIMADGATSSFAGGRFARSLARAYLSCGSMDWKLKIAAARDMFARQIDSETLSWSQKISYDRGSFATLLSLEEKPKGILATAVGDTCCFTIDKNTYLPIQSFPIESPGGFGLHPSLVGSREEDGVMFLPIYRQKYWSGKLIAYRDLANAWILCATDAIARFILVNREDANLMQALIGSLNGRERFCRFVEDARRRGLDVDDTTVALLDTGTRDSKGSIG